MSSKKSEIILKGPILKAILTLSIPIMVSNLIQTIYNLTDSYFVSKLGTSQMAAMQVTFPIIFLLISLGAGLSVGGVALISQYVGAKKEDEAKKVAGQLITATMIVSFFVAIVGFLFAEKILILMNAEGDLLKYATQFTRIMFLGAPTMFISFAFNGMKQGQGDMITPMLVSGGSVALNIILDPIFIFVLGWGIQGAAVATVISRGLFNILALYLIFNKKHNTLKIKKKDLKLNKEYLGKIVEVGAPAAFGQATTALGFAVMNAFIISYGENIVTAFAIGNRWNSLILMPAMGIGGALSTIIGQNIGAGNIKRASKAFVTSSLFSTAIMVFGGSIMFFFTKDLVKVFTDDAFIIQEASAYLKLIILSLPLVGLFSCLTGLFQGSGHTLSAMMISMGRLWALRIPMILLLQVLSIEDPTYIWYAMILSNVIIVSFGLILFSSGRWKVPVIKKSQERLNKKNAIAS